METDYPRMAPLMGCKGREGNGDAGVGEQVCEFTFISP